MMFLPPERAAGTNSFCRRRGADDALRELGLGDGVA